MRILRLSSPGHSLYEPEWFHRAAGGSFTAIVPPGESLPRSSKAASLATARARISRVLGLTARPTGSVGIDRAGNSKEVAEDWDGRVRMPGAGELTGLTTGRIWCDEDKIRDLAYCAKNARYTKGPQRLVDTCGERGRQLLVARLDVCLAWRLLRHPRLGAGLVVLKAGWVGLGAVLASGRVGLGALRAAGLGGGRTR